MFMSAIHCAVGTQFNDWTVASEKTEVSSDNLRIHVRCKCGFEGMRDGWSVRLGRTKRCRTCASRLVSEAYKGAGATCGGCKRKRCLKAGGLCSACFNKKHLGGVIPVPIPEVGARKPASSPTHHPPGTPGKVEAMITRAERGEHLFHKDDAKSHDNYQAA
jgi:hypothetical protein